MYGRHAPATCRWQWYISDQNTVTKYQPLQSALPDTLCLTFPIHIMKKFHNHLISPNTLSVTFPYIHDSDFKYSFTANRSGKIAVESARISSVGAFRSGTMIAGMPAAASARMPL